MTSAPGEKSCLSDGVSSVGAGRGVLVAVGLLVGLGEEAVASGAGLGLRVAGELGVCVGTGEGVHVGTGVGVGGGVRVGLQFGVAVFVCVDIVPSMGIDVRPPAALDGLVELGLELG
jgi:hypothetical protein